MADYFSIKPFNSDLKGLVLSIWDYQSNLQHDYEQVLPGIGSQMLINRHEDELRHWAHPGKKSRTIGPVGVQGVLTAPVLIDTKQKRNICGVEFASFGLSAFCDTPASRFTDSIVDGAKVWGSSAMLLHTTLLTESEPEKRCQIIEKFLIERLIDQSEEIKLISKIQSLILDGTSITEIRDQFSLSQRALYSLFDRRIGVRPKTFSRIGRFGCALGALSKTKPLADVALDNDFSDQAHLTREFRVFSGKAPTQYDSVPDEIRHVPHQVDKIFKTQSGK